MGELRIAARVRNSEVLASVKAAAATYRAHLIQWNDAFSADSNLKGADLVVLEAANSNTALHELQAAKEACPKAEIVVLAGAATSPEDMRRLFRAGARDVLGLPIAHDQLMSVLAEAIGPGRMSDNGAQVLGVIKASGGVGATTLAVNIAGYFANPPRIKKTDAQAPIKVAVLDFDLQFGSVALAMDLNPRKTIADILRTPKRLDSLFLDSVLERHRSCVNVLAAPPGLTPLDAMDGDIATSIVNVAAASHDLVIIEHPTGLTDWSGVLLRRADHLLLVSSPTVRSVSGARRILDAAADLKVEPSCWAMAFNRLASVLDGKDAIDQARRALNTSVLGALNEDESVQDAGERGRLIWDHAPNSRFTKDLRAMCGAINEKLVATSPPQRLPVR
jgi:pilus assembly protein CpaE